MNTELEIESDGAMTPPTQPGPLGSPQNPVIWPTVLGVIAIVFGSAGALGGIWQVASLFFLDWLEAWMGDLMQGQPTGLEAIGPWQPAMAVIGAAAFALALVLLFVGIGLVKRRARSVGAARVWAMSKIVYAVAATIVMYFMQCDQFDVMLSAQQGGGMPPRFFFDAILVVGSVISVAWLAALPVFFFIWFSRKSVKDEVARWT